jgi:hypothetical protein
MVSASTMRATSAMGSGKPTKRQSAIRLTTRPLKFLRPPMRAKKINTASAASSADAGEATPSASVSSPADDFAEFVRTKIADADEATTQQELDEIDDAVCIACQRENREDQRKLWNAAYAANIQRFKRDRQAQTPTPAKKKK